MKTRGGGHRCRSSLALKLESSAIAKWWWWWQPMVKKRHGWRHSRALLIVRPVLVCTPSVTLSFEIVGGANISSASCRYIQFARYSRLIHPFLLTLVSNNSLWFVWFSIETPNHLLLFCIFLILNSLKSPHPFLFLLHTMQCKCLPKLDTLLELHKLRQTICDFFLYLSEMKGQRFFPKNKLSEEATKSEPVKGKPTLRYRFFF